MGEPVYWLGPDGWYMFTGYGPGMGTMQDAAGGADNAASRDTPPPAEKTPVDVVVDSLNAGGVSKPDKQRLRGALDKADAPPTGRAASDQALGRIASR